MPASGTIQRHTRTSSSEKGLDLLDAPITRLGARNVPMPYKDKFELATIPSHDDILAAIRSVL